MGINIIDYRGHYIAVILVHYIAHFDLQKKKIMKFAQFEKWLLWYILWRFQIREQLSFKNVLYHSVLETKVSCITYC